MDNRYRSRTMEERIRESDDELQRLLVAADAVLPVKRYRKDSRPLCVVAGYAVRLLTGVPHLGPREPPRQPIVEGAAVYFFPEHPFADPGDLGRWAIEELGLPHEKAAALVMEVQRREMMRMRDTGRRGCGSCPGGSINQSRTNGRRRG